MTAHIGPYELLGPLGKGGSGSVFRARHADHADPVALKLVTRAGRAEDEVALVHEIRAMASLEHPHILWLHDHGVVSQADAERVAGVQPGQHYLVLELADGDLRPYVGRLDWLELRDVLLQLLDGLAHAHARDMVHRDLKPANVLVGGVRPGVKIADFGLADLPDDRRGTAERSVPAGSAAFMAPEQCRDAWRDFGPHTDLYALGCLAWRLAAGRGPFGGRSFREVMGQQLNQPPPAFLPARPVAEGFEDWLRTLLRKPIAERPGTAAQAALALRQLSTLALPSEDGPGGVTGRADADAPTARLPRSAGPTLVAPPAPTLAVQALQAAAAEPSGDSVELPPTPWIDRPARVPSAPPWIAEHTQGLRPHAPGQRRARETLWRSLGEVHRDREARVVLLRGGRDAADRAAAWICHRSHELGLATRAVAHFDPGDNPGSGLRRLAINVFQLAGLARARGTRRLRRWFDEDSTRVLGSFLWPDEQAGSAGAASVLLARYWRRQSLPTVLVLSASGGASEPAAIAACALEAGAPVLIVVTLDEVDAHGSPALAALATQHPVAVEHMEPTVPGRWRPSLTWPPADPKVQHALELAAVLGRGVTAAEWRGCCEIADVHPACVVPQLLSGALLPQPHGDGWRFASGSLRSDIVEALGDPARHTRLTEASELAESVRRAVLLEQVGREDEAASIWLQANFDVAEDGLVASDRAKACLEKAEVPETDARWSLMFHQRDWMLTRLGQHDAASACHREALRLSREHRHPVLAKVWLRRAIFARRVGDGAANWQALERALEHGRALGQSHAVSIALHNMSLLRSSAGMKDAAHALSTEAAAEPDAPPFPFLFLAATAAMRGDWAEAEAQLERGERRAWGGHSEHVASLLYCRGFLLGQRGMIDQSLAMHRRSLRFAELTGHYSAAAATCEGAARWALRADRLDEVTWFTERGIAPAQRCSFLPLERRLRVYRLALPPHGDRAEWLRACRPAGVGEATVDSESTDAWITVAEHLERVGRSDLATCSLRAAQWTRPGDPELQARIEALALRLGLEEP